MVPDCAMEQRECFPNSGSKFTPVSVFANQKGFCHLPKFLPTTGTIVWLPCAFIPVPAVMLGLAEADISLPVPGAEEDPDSFGVAGLLGAV